MEKCCLGAVGKRECILSRAHGKYRLYFSSLQGLELTPCFVVQYAIERSYVNNLFSILDPRVAETERVLQIDANLAYPAVVLVRH